MNLCPITYEVCDNGKYSKKGLLLFSKKLKHLRDFPFTPNQQILLAAEMANKISIQGIQPKLSVQLSLTKETLETVMKNGKYIIKPPHQNYAELPQNEDLTMKLAEMIGIEVPFHGMIYNIDGSLSYIIRRFDRFGKNQKVAVEDFSQLLGYSRETKNESSMEQVITVIEKHCSFPEIEKIKLFRLTIFNFLVGNEDMHLKNFSLIRREGKVTLSPAYDLLNTTMALTKPKEEIALPIRGRKSMLTRSDLVDYFGHERLNINPKIIESELNAFASMIEPWLGLIDKSFLSLELRNKYKALVKERWQRLQSTSRKPSKA